MRKAGWIFVGLIISFSSIFIGACNQIGLTKTPAPTDRVASKPAYINVVNPTQTNRPIDVVVKKEMSCVPSVNPYKKETDFDKYMYSVMELPNIDITKKCTFSGHINRGETFIHQFTKKLIFCLVPGGVFSDVPEEGWFIQIFDSRSQKCLGIQDDYDNLGPIITPPYRGNMDFDILGWFFRNKDNTGPNDGSVNAPQMVREFNFLFNQNDYDKVLYPRRCSMWNLTEDCMQATQNAANQNEKIPHSSAKLTITDFTLGNLIKDSHAWIEEMDFSVDVYLPDDE